MTKKSVVFIFALCALCTFSGSFHGSAEPIPSHDEDKAVEVEMTDMSSGLLIGSGIKKGIQLQKFVKRSGSSDCVYEIKKNHAIPNQWCNISKPKTPVECVVENVSLDSCPKVTNDKLKVSYMDSAVGPDTKGSQIVGHIHIGNVGIETFPKSFDAPLFKYKERGEYSLRIYKQFNLYEVAVSLL
eukprot:Nk52_evm1s215 gene=Nk52_evmTU1s215